MRLAWCFVLLCVLCAVFEISVADNPSTSQDVEVYHHSDMNAPSEACSREKSRRVRSIIREVVLHKLEKENYELPDECPLSPELDKYLPHEENKQSVSVHMWKCEVCGKTFKGEEFIDKHMHRKHLDLIPEDRSVCLGDMCDIFNCERASSNDDNDSDSDDDNKHKNKNKNKKTNSLKSILEKCDQSKMKRMNHKCMALVSKCFPPDQDDVSHRLSTYFGTVLCSHFTCDLRVVDPAQMYQNIVDAKSTSEGWMVLTCAVIVCLCVYYIIIFIFYREAQPRDEFWKKRSWFGKRELKTKEF